MRWVGAAVVAVAMLAGCAAPSPAARTADFGATGLPHCPQWTHVAMSRLPETSLRCMDGSGATVRLDGRPHTPTILTLWAPWCAPCRAELPALQRLRDRARGKVEVLGVVTRGEPQPSVDLAHELRLTFPELYDADGLVLGAIGKQALPATVLVRADGTIATVYQGPALTDAAAARLAEQSFGVTL